MKIYSISQIPAREYRRLQVFFVFVFVVWHSCAFDRSSSLCIPGRIVWFGLVRAGSRAGPAGFGRQTRCGDGVLFGKERVGSNPKQLEKKICNQKQLFQTKICLRFLKMCSEEFSPKIFTKGLIRFSKHIFYV